MNVQEWAERLNGREYGCEMRQGEDREAERDGVVICFGESDDLVTLAGAIDDQVGAFDGATLLLTRAGVLPERERSDDEVLERLHLLAYAGEREQRAAKVLAVWGPEGGNGLSWRLETEVPHGRFTIYEDGQPYCEGVVISAADLPE